MPFPSENKSAGRPEFIFIGEHPAIDFANTRVVAEGNPVELLPSWVELVNWLSEAGLITDDRAKLTAAAGAKALQRVLELREAWENVLSDLVSGGKVNDAFLERINGLLVPDSFHHVLQREGRKGFDVSHSASRLHGEQFALSVLARQIANFLREANLNYLHRCANTTSCVLYFYDTTKNHRRQWCSVATCGNRHKVAQFRQRQAKAAK